MSATPFSGERPAYAFIITDEIARKAKSGKLEHEKEEMINEIVSHFRDLAFFKSQPPVFWQDVRDFAGFTGITLPDRFPIIDKEFLLNWCRVLEGQGLDELSVLSKLYSIDAMFGERELPYRFSEFLASSSSIYEDKGAIVVLIPDYAFTSEEWKVLSSDGLNEIILSISIFDGHGREIPFEDGDYQVDGNFKEYGCNAEYAFGDFCYPDKSALADNYETLPVNAVFTVEIADGVVRYEVVVTLG